MVDYGRRRSKGLPERSSCGATGHQSTLRQRREGEGDGAGLTMAYVGRRSGEVAPVAERIEVRQRCSVWSKWRHGEAKQGAAQGGGGGEGKGSAGVGFLTRRFRH
jgi:hypothetical protein